MPPKKVTTVKQGRIFHRSGNVVDGAVLFEYHYQINCQSINLHKPHNRLAANMVREKKIRGL